MGHVNTKTFGHQAEIGGAVVLLLLPCPPSTAVPHARTRTHRQWQLELADVAAGRPQVWHYAGGRPTTMDHIIAKRLKIKVHGPKAAAAKRAAAQAKKEAAARPAAACGGAKRARGAAGIAAPRKRPLAAAAAAAPGAEGSEDGAAPAAEAKQVPTLTAHACSSGERARTQMRVLVTDHLVPPLCPLAPEGTRAYGP